MFLCVHLLDVRIYYRLNRNRLLIQNRICELPIREVGKKWWWNGILLLTNPPEKHGIIFRPDDSYYIRGSWGCLQARQCEV